MSFKESLVRLLLVVPLVVAWYFLAPSIYVFLPGPEELWGFTGGALISLAAFS